MWLDSVIGWFNPRAQLQRQRYRLALDQVRLYQGAKTGPRTDGWISNGTSSNAELQIAGAKLRERSRDLARNNPHAVKALASVVANLIGTGILPQPTTESQKKKIDSLWRRWIMECDADGNLDFYGIQSLVCRTEKESGECIVRLRQRRTEDGLSVPLQLQVLEPDYIDTSRDGPTSTGYVMQGIQFDLLGRRVGYWLYDHHPGDTLNTGNRIDSRLIRAENVLHVYEKKRPGQIRGVPLFAPVMVKMRDLDDYEEAALLTKKIEACFAAFITQPDGIEPVTIAPQKKPAVANDIRVESFEPGMITYLRAGEDVKFGEPKPVGGYAEYTTSQLRAIAAGLGITYEMLTSDLSQVNYSSMRAGTNEFRRCAEQYQWNTFVPQFCHPVWNAFVSAAFLSGQISEPEISVSWTAPRWAYVNPVEDVESDKEAIKGMLLTHSEAIRRQGYDPEQVFQEMAADREKLNKLGLVTDTDPSHELAAKQKTLVQQPVKAVK